MHRAIRARCNLEGGIDPVRARRGQEDTESSSALPFRQCRRAKGETKVREISLVARLE